MANNNISMEELAKIQAILDIREELRKEHKHMLAFIKRLNPKMEELVKEHYELAQK